MCNTMNRLVVLQFLLLAGWLIMRLSLGREITPLYTVVNDEVILGYVSLLNREKLLKY